MLECGTPVPPLAAVGCRTPYPPDLAVEEGETIETPQGAGGWALGFAVYSRYSLGGLGRGYFRFPEG